MAFTDELEKGRVYICTYQDLYSLQCTWTNLFFFKGSILKLKLVLISFFPINIFWSVRTRERGLWIAGSNYK